MKFFTNKKSRNTLDKFVTVNCEVTAKISDRVDLQTQNIEFAEDNNSDQILFLARSYEVGFPNSRKGMLIQFTSELESKSYSPKDPDFPFSEFNYFESADNGEFETFYDYRAVSGTIDVEVVEKSSEALRYRIKYNIVGSDSRAGELDIVGKAELNVFKRSS